MATSLVKTPPEHRLGPAMQALNERQRKFVIALLEFPSIDHTKAALVAGYASESQAYIRVQAWRLAHDDKVQAAILEESKRRINAGVAMAASRLLEIADNERTSTRDKLRALEMIFDRGGIAARSEHKIEVEHTTDQETLARLNKLAEKLGLDPSRLLGSIGAKVIDGEIIEADFTEVKDGTSGTDSGGQGIAHSDHDGGSAAGHLPEDEFAYTPEGST